MEEVLIKYSPEQIKTPKRNSRPLIFKSTERSIHGGLLQIPPSSSFSFSNPSSARFHNHQDPPAPILRPMNSSHLSRTRGISCPPTTRTANRGDRARDLSLTPKRLTSTRSYQESMQDLRSTAREEVSQFLIVASTDRLGPDPIKLPKVEVSRIFSSSLHATGKGFGMDKEKGTSEEFSGSVSILSPPPSSLPLPKFSTRQKLNCGAEVTGIDVGATENLRRLLCL